MKVCSRCKTEKGLEEFPRDRTKKDGRNNWCKECVNTHNRHSLGRKEYMTRYNRENVEKTVKFNLLYAQVGNSFKEENPCTDCGQFFPYYVMEFDHVNGRGKKIFTHRAPSQEVLRLRMQEHQVELVCANCHAIRTHERRVASACI